MNSRPSSPDGARFLSVGLILLAVAASLGAAQEESATIQKLGIGVGVWLVTAILAFVIWKLLKVLAKVGVIMLPILAGVVVVMLLPDEINQITLNAVLARSAIVVTWGVAASLACYLYANLYDLDRDLDRVKQAQAEPKHSVVEAPAPPQEQPAAHS